MSKLISAATVAAILTGCAGNGLNIHTAALADAATTYHGIDSGTAYETNPLIGDSAAGAAMRGYALKMVTVYGAKALAGNSTCKFIYKMTTAGGFAGATNNAVVIAEGNNSAAIGVGAGIVAYNASKGSARKFCSKG